MENRNLRHLSSFKIPVIDILIRKLDKNHHNVMGSCQRFQTNIRIKLRLIDFNFTNYLLHRNTNTNMQNAVETFECFSAFWQFYLFSTSIIIYF